MNNLSSRIILGLFVLPFFPFNLFTEIPHSFDPVTEVKKTLDEQVIAWNNGDLEKAMSYYWNSSEMLWINKSGIQKGYQPVWEHFQKEFADRSKMGIYSCESLHIEKVTSFSVYFVIRWKIVLSDKKIMGGVSSQLWKKIAGNWVITIEHAS